MSNSWTLARTFAVRAQEHPRRTMLVADGRSLTYAQVDAKSAALAAALSELGIEEGDRVAIVMPNWPEWIITLIAAARLGATVVPLNPRLSYHELKYQLRHAEVSAVFALERHRGVDYLQIFEDIVTELPDLLYLVTVGNEDLWYDDRIFHLGDLHVRAVRRLRAPARRRVVVQVRRRVGDGQARDRSADRLRDRPDLVGADELVDLGHLGRQLLRVALGQAAGDDQPLARARLLVAGHVEDRVDRLLLRLADEAAGVDDDDVGGLGIGDQTVAGVGRVAEHDLCVDAVLRTTEGDEMDVHDA